MGYRSDVLVGIDKEKYAERMLLDGGIPQDLALKHAEKADVQGRTILYWFFGYNKWYDSYPEVKAVNQFVEDLAGEFDELSAEEQKARRWVNYAGLLRIGEEDTDIDSIGDPYSLDIYCSRRPVCPAEGLIE